MASFYYLAPHPGDVSLWWLRFGTEWRCLSPMCKVAREVEVVGGPRGPIVIIVDAIQCKVD